MDCSVCLILLSLEGRVLSPMVSGGWETVKRKAVRDSPRWDVFPWGGGMGGSRREALTSVYFSNFPDSFSAKSFFELFACIGKVVEVAISLRKNRFGRKYGFVRFDDAEDGRLIAIRCDNVMIMGVKIHANLPRFERNRIDSSKGGGSKFNNGGGVSQRKDVLKVTGGSGRVVGDGRSFAKVVLEGGRSSSNVHSMSQPKIQYSSKEEDRKRLLKAFVGVVSIPGSTFNIQYHFEMEGYFQVKVTPMGGNLCLLEESEEGVIEDLIGVGETWWKQWFTVVRRWNELDIDDGRFSWISIYGVPIHAWNAEFFMAVANTLGSFICIDESTAEGSSFDTARMMVRVKLNHVLPPTMEVLIDDKIFVLTLKEDAVGAMRNSSGTRKVFSPVSSENDSLDSVDNLSVNMFEEEKGCESDDVILLSNPTRKLDSSAETEKVSLSVKPLNSVGSGSDQKSKSGESLGVGRLEGVNVVEGGLVVSGCDGGVSGGGDSPIFSFDGTLQEYRNLLRPLKAQADNSNCEGVFDKAVKCRQVGGGVNAVKGVVPVVSGTQPLAEGKAVSKKLNCKKFSDMRNQKGVLVPIKTRKKRCSGKTVRKKGRTATVASLYISNSDSICSFGGENVHRYGYHEEAADIHQSNNRQWNFMDEEGGKKLGAGMAALGVGTLDENMKMLDNVVFSRKSGEDGKKSGKEFLACFK